MTAKYGQLPTVALLLSEGADPNFKHKEITDLHRLCKPRKYPQFLDYEDLYIEDTGQATMSRWKFHTQCLK